MLIATAADVDEARDDDDDATDVADADVDADALCDMGVREKLDSSPDDNCAPVRVVSGARAREQRVE